VRVRDARGVVHEEHAAWYPRCEPERCFMIEPDFDRVRLTEDALTCVQCLALSVKELVRRS
jgi:hypothetical protein